MAWRPHAGWEGDGGADCPPLGKGLPCAGLGQLPMTLAPPRSLTWALTQPDEVVPRGYSMASSCCFAVHTRVLRSKYSVSPRRGTSPCQQGEGHVGVAETLCCDTHGPSSKEARGGNDTWRVIFEAAGKTLTHIRPSSPSGRGLGWG